MQRELSKLLNQEIEAAVKSVLSDVERHLLPDETQLNVQVWMNCYLHHLALIVPRSNFYLDLFKAFHAGFRYRYSQK